MKKISILLSMFALSLLLVACGSTSEKPSDDTTGQQQESNHNDQTTDSKGEVENDKTEDGKTEDSKATDAERNSDSDEVSLMKKLAYKEFELEVEYNDGKEYEAKLELKHDDRVKAKIEDELNNHEIEGSQAFDELYPIVESTTIEQGTSKEEAIKQVLDAFSLDENYKDFELEIDFHDGTKLEFQDQK